MGPARSGELSTERYRALDAEYTARAARVLNELHGDGAAKSARRQFGASSRWKLWVAAAVVLAAAAVMLSNALNARQPGSTVSGNDQSSDSVAAAELRALAGAVEQRPADAGTRLSYARALLGSGEAAEAVKQFDEATKLDPANAEARAYAGWLVFLAGLPDEGLRWVDAAIAADPDYPDAHFFRGMILLRGKEDDEAAARLSLARYLELTPPDAPLRGEVERVLSSLSDSPVPTSSTLVP